MYCRFNGFVLSVGIACNHQRCAHRRGAWRPCFLGALHAAGAQAARLQKQIRKPGRAQASIHGPCHGAIVPGTGERELRRPAAKEKESCRAPTPARRRRRRSNRESDTEEESGKVWSWRGRRRWRSNRCWLRRRKGGRGHCPTCRCRSRRTCTTSASSSSNA
jgi:hypothetical protein